MEINILETLERNLYNFLIDSQDESVKNNFEKKIRNSKDFMDKTGSAAFYMKSLNPASNIYHAFFENLYFIVVDMFEDDVRNFYTLSNTSKSETELKEINIKISEINKLLYDISRFHSINLKISDIEELIIKTQNVIDKKINNYKEDAIIEEVDKKSTSIFNLGFYLLNSRNLLGIPDEDIKIGNFDFKINYFPDYKVICYQDYATAYKLFRIALKLDSRNILAKIFAEVALLEESLNNEYSNVDRSKVIEKLESLVLDHPDNALAHIELATGYASCNNHEKARVHIDNALRIDNSSYYINYKVFLIYSCYLSDEITGKKMLSRLSDFEVDDPRYNYYMALEAYVANDVASAMLYIDKALANKKIKEHLFLRNQIYSAFRSEVSADNYNAEKMDAIIVADQLTLKEIDNRASLYPTAGYLKFHLIEVSNDFNVCKISFSSDSLPQISNLVAGKDSIRFVDFKCNYKEMATHNILPLPLIFNSGTCRWEDGTLLLRNLDLDNLFLHD